MTTIETADFRASMKAIRAINCPNHLAAILAGWTPKSPARRGTYLDLNPHLHLPDPFFAFGGAGRSQGTIYGDLRWYTEEMTPDQRHELFGHIPAQLDRAEVEALWDWRARQLTK